MSARALEEKPVKEILVTMHMMSYLFAILFLAAAIAWIYYTAKAVEHKVIGGKDGETSPVTTAETMFEGAVISMLAYLIFRHHFSQSHA